jgi:hypothetical protein
MTSAHRDWCATLDDRRAEYQAAGLPIIDTPGEDEFVSMCPVCAGTPGRTGGEVRVYVGEDGRTVDECANRCDRSRIADALHFRSGAQADAEQRRNGHHPPRLQVLDTLRLVTTEPPPLDWLADGVFCRGKLTLFGGREKRGKSLVQLALAVRMASGGGELADTPVKPGRVLIVDAENGERETHRRLRAMGLEADHARNLIAVEARGFDLLKHLAELVDLADRHQPDLLLLDSFRALWRGDERDEAEVAAALDPLRDLAHDRDLGIGLTHHAQKGGEEYRGSSAIGASVEWCCMLDRHPEDDDKTRRRLTNPLARFAPERPDRWLSIRSGGDDGPVTLAATKAFVREHDAPVRDEITAAIRDFIEGCTGVLPTTEGDTPTPPSWTTADLCRAAGRQAKDRTARQAIQGLADAGVIYRNGGSRWQPAPSLLDDEEAAT